MLLKHVLLFGCAAMTIVLGDLHACSTCTKRHKAAPRNTCRRKDLAEGLVDLPFVVEDLVEDLHRRHAKLMR